MNNIAEFFPEIVYRCDCLAEVIASCSTKETCSLKDICDEINKINGEKIYCAKCGENKQNVVLSCDYHMPMALFAEQNATRITDVTLLDVTTECCLTCIRKYLERYYYIFKHEIFKKN